MFLKAALQFLSIAGVVNYSKSHFGLFKYSINHFYWNRLREKEENVLFTKTDIQQSYQCKSIKYAQVVILLFQALKAMPKETIIEESG